MHHDARSQDAKRCHAKSPEVLLFIMKSHDAKSRHAKGPSSGLVLYKLCLCRPADKTGGGVFVRQAKSWQRAQRHCRDLLLDLVGVGSVEENEAVRNLSQGQEVWIGLFRDSWTWSDGSNSSFRFWRPGQPNSPDQECVAVIFLAGGQWNDLECSGRRHFICHGRKCLIFVRPSVVRQMTHSVFSQPGNQPMRRVHR